MFIFIFRGLSISELYHGDASGIQRLTKGMVGLAMTGPRMRATTSLYTRQRAEHLHGVSRRLIGTEVRACNALVACALC